jgi:serine/threonine protein kinase
MPQPTVARNVMHAGDRPSTSLDVHGVIDGRYLVKRLLATGGAAEVYAAEHRFTHRAVTVKYPLTADEKTVARARREIEALARVRGSGVVEMLDAAELDGRPYIVFELLEGRTLAGLVTARGKLSIDDSVRVGMELAKTLQRIHSVGVVHRDVKPSNLFVTMHPERQLMLLDFGIAKIVADDAPKEKLTRECALLGTPEYMAPEALLSTDDADHRVDIYGLGVVLYECLTGTVPFDGRYADVLMKISSEQPRSVRDLRPEVPADLARVVMKCLSRSAGDRYPTGEALLSALRACAPPGVSSVRLLTGLTPPEDTGAEHLPVDSPAAGVAPNAGYRRKHARAPYTTLARITLNSGATVDGRIEEVSEGGLAFVGERALTVGEPVRIRFGLPTSGRIVEVSSTTRWNRTMRGTNATGFEFHDLPDAARDEVKSYVALMRAETS